MSRIGRQPVSIPDGVSIDVKPGEVIVKGPKGVGYRAQLKGKALELALGSSHPVSLPAPDGIEFEVPQPTEIVVRGIDKQLVGETAARVRKSRPPEPY
ncbi:MAG: 50S ribosomal protein L6, partial [Solirubrobacterales bacterium]